jgi:hypothetical protein
VLVVGALLGGACSPPVPPLEHGQPSADAVARAVLDALQRRDVAALQALALDEQEFRDHVWPELPAARPERNLPFSYVWGDLHQKSAAALAGVAAAYGGQRYTLKSVRFRGPTSQYDTYLVHRDAELTLQDAAGSEQNARFFGSVLEKDGQFKVFSYVVD